MIRLPPTSISLSESDVQLHLREINIYEDLLRQGFKRDAIQRYYASIRLPLASAHRQSSFEPANHYTDQALPLLSTTKPDPAAVTGLGQGNEADHNTSSVKQTAQELQKKNAETEIIDIARHSDAGAFAPSTVRLRAGMKMPPEASTSPAQGPASSAAGQQYQLQEETDQAHNADDSHTSTLASSLNLPTRNRPRESSLLHITRNAASSSPSGQSDDSFKSTVTEMPRPDTPEFDKSPRRMMTYRPRSRTYSWVESEADDHKEALEFIEDVNACPRVHSPQARRHDTASTESQQIEIYRTDSLPAESQTCPDSTFESAHGVSTTITALRQTSSRFPLRVEAEDFVPLRLPPPFSATRRISSGQHNLPSSIDTYCPSIIRHDIPFQSSQSFAASTPTRNSSFGNLSRNLVSYFTSSSHKSSPSSPPSAGAPSSSPEEGITRREPTTPARRGRPIFRETQPRVLPKTPRTQARTQHTDGPGSVYNDRIPAYLQPRTPADLARGRYITHLEAAYTAPPGRTARTPATITHSPVRPGEPGEESPSRRARTLRDRRERELRRSTAMEEAMWERFREMEQEDDVGRRMPWAGWRDDFDADRQGEENFDEEGALRMPTLGSGRMEEGRGGR